tara:strand:+ start:257 stop:676 length:420 start_codon:yes stop_codon:yes gene_type:complete
MKKHLALALLPITLIGIACTGLKAKADHSNSSTAEKGAKIYCFMRSSGNSHEVSWQASYALIKRQTNNIFKTSPRHAAVMIVESVVQNPNDYENCGSYLGDLFGEESLINQENDSPKKSEFNEENDSPKKSEFKDRYKY